jgi:hypothetical protein
MTNPIEQIVKQNYLSSWSWNSQYDDLGYLHYEKGVSDCPTILDVSKVPNNDNSEQGIRIFHSHNLDDYTHKESNTFERVRYPLYRDLYYEVKKFAQFHLGRKLLTTYYTDRIFHSGDSIPPSISEDDGEVKVLVCLGSNLNKEWNHYIKTRTWYDDRKKLDVVWKQGVETKFSLSTGDVLIYNGVEIPYYTQPLLSNQNRLVQKFKKVDDTYAHFLICNFVFRDGDRAHCYAKV